MNKRTISEMRLNWATCGRACLSLTCGVLFWGPLAIASTSVLSADRSNCLACAINATSSELQDLLDVVHLTTLLTWLTVPCAIISLFLACGAHSVYTSSKTNGFTRQQKRTLACVLIPTFVVYFLLGVLNAILVISGMGDDCEACKGLKSLCVATVVYSVFMCFGTGILAKRAFFPPSTQYYVSVENPELPLPK